MAESTNKSVESARTNPGQTSAVEKSAAEIATVKKTAAEKSAKSEKSLKRQGITIAISLAAVIIIITALILIVPQLFQSLPTLTMVAPGPVTALSGEEFHVDIVLSEMPDDGLYPAASISVSFDTNKLTFTGVRMGTMEVGSPGSMIIPEWAVNPEVSNQRGLINAMYLDMSAGDAAYIPEGFESGSRDILLTLSFILRDSARAGDNLELVFEDAVFAVIPDGQIQGLQMVDETLRTVNATIVVN